MIKYAPKHSGMQNNIKLSVNLEQLLPSNKSSYYYFRGSLTTPPCTENVNWVVMQQPITASKAQLDMLHKLFGSSNRPVQPRHSRIIIHTQ